ncbi:MULTISPECIES: flippase [unclassified Arenibacter]|uniref:flippase n=1 Tax=unclassified Arenibacter TaxID=2615047 RepID=UPI000E348D7D|nr:MULTISPECIES: flippase [unclassified Arenibacter]MCM4161969.1 hypothetical protein [Arenibacter sp. A80]RFT57601.1 flippase [Arenibacter sp. P308M17]
MNSIFINNIWKSKKFANTFWAVVSKLISGVKLVVIGVIVARSLGPEDFGSYNYVISFVTLLSVLAEFRFHNILIREISEQNAKTELILGSTFISCIMFSILGYISLTMLVYVFESDKNLQWFILLFGISYFFQTLRFLRALFIAKLKNNIIFKIETTVGIVVIILALLFGFGKGSVLLFILLRIFDVFLVSILFLFFYQLIYKNLFEWKFSRDFSWGLIKNSFPLVISSLALVVFQQFDKIMIKQILDEYSVGQYSASVSIISLIVFIPIVITEAVSPYLIQMKIIKNAEDYKIRLQIFSDYIIWGSIVLSFIIMLLSPIIIQIVYGPKYYESIAIMKVFAWQGVLIAMGAVSAQIMIIDNTHQIAYLKSISGGILNIVLNIFWIPKYGIMGAVFASLLAYGISSYIIHYFIKRYRYIFFIQSKSLTHGLLNIYYNLKKINDKNDKT